MKSAGCQVIRRVAEKGGGLLIGRKQCLHVPAQRAVTVNGFGQELCALFRNEFPNGLTEFDYLSVALRCHTASQRYFVAG